MVITYHGAEAFKIQFSDIVIAYNPVSKQSKFKSNSFGADIALSSLNHPDFNGFENTSRGERQSFTIAGPGEYEIKEVFIKGFPSESNYGGSARLNTIYTVSLEGMNLCFLGALTSPNLKSEVIEALDGIDILFLPIGGDDVLNSGEANKLSVQLEPKVIIPMHFGEIGDKNALKVFLKEGGEEKVTPMDKFTVRKKDLESKEGEIIVLNPTNN